MAKHKPIIDKEKCKDCGLCIYYCPKKCLSKSKSFNKFGYNPAELMTVEKCNSCGTCYIVCPDCAITIEQGE